MKKILPILILVVAGLLAACKDDGVKCTQVKIVDGCSAQCSRLDKTSAPAKFCTKQLVLSQAGENTIMHSDIKKMETRSLNQEVCFAVGPDQTIADAVAQDELTKACGE